MMPITYVRTTPFPLCRSCGKRMDYWVPFQNDEDAEHPECAGKRMANEICDKAAKQMEAALEQE